MQIFEAVQENKPFIMNVYRCVHQEQVEKYLQPLVDQLLLDVINEESAGMTVRSEDKQFIAQVYSYIFIGLMLDWIKDDMREDPRYDRGTACPPDQRLHVRCSRPVQALILSFAAVLIKIFTLSGSVIRLLSRGFFCLL